MTSILIYICVLYMCACCIYLPVGVCHKYAIFLLVGKANEMNVHLHKVIIFGSCSWNEVFTSALNYIEGCSVVTFC